MKKFTQIKVRIPVFLKKILLDAAAEKMTPVSRLTGNVVLNHIEEIIKLKGTDKQIGRASCRERV